MKKAPALVKRLTSALVELGYTTEEAQDMISNEGTASIAAFIQDELKFAKQQQAPTASVTLTPTGEKDMALKCEVGTNGKYKSVETIDTGYGVQAAKPLPKVDKQVPTVVEPAVQISSKPTPNEQAPMQELLYDYNRLPVALQRLVDDINLHKLPTTEQLPVLHVVGWNSDTSEFIYKCTAGQAAVNAYLWLYTTAPRDYQNIPAIVVAPTDVELLKRYNTQAITSSKSLPAQADYKLMSPKVLKTVATLDMQQFAKVVAPPASEPKVAAKVVAKDTKAKAKAEAEAPAKAEAKAVVTEDLLQELATATNHMKKVSLVNKIHLALGLAKVDSKSTKASLQPIIDDLLKKFSVAVPEPAAKEKAPAKAKATKEPAPKALTKGEIEKLWTTAHIRETGVDAKVAKKAFAAIDINWRSSVERAQFVADQGLV